MTELRTDSPGPAAFIEDAARLQFAMNAAGVGVWEVNTVTNKVTWDDRGRALFGIANPEIPFEQAIQYIHPDDKRGVNEKVQAALRGENDGHYDATYRTIGADDGTLRWVNFSGKAYFDEGGNAVWFGGICQDVTPSMLALEAEKQEQTKRFRRRVQNAIVPICVFKGEDMVVEITNDLLLAFWQKDHDVLGKPLLEIFPEWTDGPFMPWLREVYHTGITARYNQIPTPYLNPDGTARIRYYNFLFQPYVEADETISGVITEAIDITEQIMAGQQVEQMESQRATDLAEANEVLQNANMELQRSNHKLEEFAHAASHDLKEPIRKIHFYTEQLRQQLKGQISEKQADTFSRITNATQRMGALVDDLLLYSHVSQHPHKKEPVDLAEKVHRVLEDLELDIQEKGAVIHTEQLPVVQGYSRQLQQLFQNLIGNAIKYSKADVPPHIDISASLVDKNGRRYHCIEVKDNGIGFEQQYEEKIFQMFARLHGKGKYSGTGVGLSIVKKIVENHGGMILVESETGIGSTFRVFLPVK